VGKACSQLDDEIWRDLITVCEAEGPYFCKHIKTTQLGLRQILEVGLTCTCRQILGLKPRMQGACCLLFLVSPDGR
jgi:hypothetical protein